MEDVPIPELKKKDILIKVHRVGICGTDVGVVHGYVKTKLPVPLGHEFSGTIAEFGKNLRSDVRGKRWFQTAAGPSNESNRQMDFWKVMESGRDLLLAQKDVFVDSTARMFYTFAAEPDDPHRYNLGSVWMMMENIS